jgi:hypothetical protein
MCFVRRLYRRRIAGTLAESDSRAIAGLRRVVAEQRVVTGWKMIRARGKLFENAGGNVVRARLSVGRHAVKLAGLSLSLLLAL